MEEIEVKILEINKKQVEDAITKMDAKKIFDGKMQNGLLFDFKDGSIVEARNVLRIRKSKTKPS